MKEINNINYTSLKAGDKIIEIDGDVIRYWEYLMIHPNNNDYVLMIESLSKDAKKVYIPTLVGGGYYTNYTFKEIYQKEIEYHEYEIERLQQRIQREEEKESLHSTTQDQ